MEVGVTEVNISAERRKEPRSRSDFSATIRVLDGDARLDGRILDLSDEGLAVFSPEPLSFGSPLAVTYKGVLILAEVVYCIPFGTGYRAGLKVDQAMETRTAEVSVAGDDAGVAERRASIPAGWVAAGGVRSERLSGTAL